MEATAWVLQGVAAARAAGAGVRFTSGGSKVAGSELAGRIERAVQGLYEAGLAPGDEVLLGIDPGIDAFVLLCACVRLEAQVTHLQGIPGTGELLGRRPTSGRRWIIAQRSLYLAGARSPLAAYLRRLGAEFPNLGRMTATHVRTGGRLPLVGGRVVDGRGFLGPVPDGWTAAPPVARTDDRGSGTGADDVRRLQLDAGADGRALGVRHSGRALGASIGQLGAVTDAGPGDTVFTNDPWVMLAALAAGAAIDLAPDDVIPREVLGHLEGGGATHAWLEPSVARRLAVHVDQLDRTLPEALRHLVLHRDHVDPRTLELLHAASGPGLRITSVYGATEWFPVAAIGSRERIAWTGAGDLVGEPLAGIDVRVEAGRLELRGDGGPVEAERADDGWWRTGDVARLDPEDGIVLLGRAGSVLERDGHTWLPAVIEQVAERVPGVGFAAFVVREDRGALFVEPDPSSTLGAKELRADVEAALERDLEVGPDEVQVLPRLPRSGGGFRMDRRQLARWMA